MPRRLKKIVPSNKTIRKNKLLKPVSHLFGDHRIWNFNKRTVAIGVAAGVFFGFLPVPFQMLFAAFVAIVLKGNLPIAMVFTWISNPFTYPIIFPINYYFGCFVLNLETISINGDFTFKYIISLGGKVLLPLFFGSIALGLIFSALSFFIMKLWWRYSISKHYIKRKAKAKIIKNEEK